MKSTNNLNEKKHSVLEQSVLTIVMSSAALIVYIIGRNHRKRRKA